MNALYIFMALVRHIHKNTGLNGTPKCQKIAIIALWRYNDVMGCMSEFLASVNLVCYN